MYENIAIVYLCCLPVRVEISLKCDDVFDRKSPKHRTQ